MGLIPNVLQGQESLTILLWVLRRYRVRQARFGGGPIQSGLGFFRRLFSTAMKCTPRRFKTALAASLQGPGTPLVRTRRSPVMLFASSIDRYSITTTSFCGLGLIG